MFTYLLYYVLTSWAIMFVYLLLMYRKLVTND